MTEGLTRLPSAELSRIRDARRVPKPTQFDYLHLKVLRDDVAAELERLAPNLDVLDVYCGTRPYEHLLPAGSRCTGLDIDDRYGAADVVSDEFLPFDDGAFDLVVCFEAFHYVPDPAAAAAELARVLRPGGHLVITVPLVWEYDRERLEHRFTGTELAAIFAGWEEVRVVENGGRGVAWSTQTGHLIHLFEQRLARRLGRFGRLLRPVLMPVYILVNGFGAVLERSSRGLTSRKTLPMNLLLSARRG